MSGRGWISSAQFDRDHRGWRNVCAACGHDGTGRDPVVVDDDGMRVHRSHLSDPASGLSEHAR